MPSPFVHLRCIALVLQVKPEWLEQEELGGPAPTQTGGRVAPMHQLGKLARLMLLGPELQISWNACLQVRFFLHHEVNI